MNNEEIYEKITNNESRLIKIETVQEEHSRILLKQQEKNESQTELNTILKMNVEQMKKFGDTLDRVDTNLKNLNENQQQINQSQKNLSERVTDIEGTLSNQKVDVITIIKYFAVGIGGLILGYIGMKLGIK